MDIIAFGDQRTPEGISLHSTFAQVTAAYPNWTWTGEGDVTHTDNPPSGPVRIQPGGNLHYQIHFSQGTMIDLEVEQDQHGCYK